MQVVATIDDWTVVATVVTAVVATVVATVIAAVIAAVVATVIAAVVATLYDRRTITMYDYDCLFPRLQWYDWLTLRYYGRYDWYELSFKYRRV